MNVISKGVTLYTAGTPNGWKVSILLKELKTVPHTVKSLSFAKNEQKDPSFLAINPNGRIPAIVDHDNNDFPVFESGAILMYLAEKSGKFFPQEFSKKSGVVQWLMFQMGGIGPMFGQAGHFIKYASVDVPYGKTRYYTETLRLLSVLDGRLESREYLAADEDSSDGYSIADMATFPWVVGVRIYGIDLKKFPNVDAWVKRIWARPAVQEGLDVPSPFPLRDSMNDPAKYEEELKKGQEWMEGLDVQK